MTENECSLSIDNGWCFWNTNESPNKCDYVHDIINCLNVKGIGLLNDDC